MAYPGAWPPPQQQWVARVERPPVITAAVAAMALAALATIGGFIAVLVEISSIHDRMSSLAGQWAEFMGNFAAGMTGTDLPFKYRLAEWIAAHYGAVLSLVIVAFIGAMATYAVCMWATIARRSWVRGLAGVAAVLSLAQLFGGFVITPAAFIPSIVLGITAAALLVVPGAASWFADPTQPFASSSPSGHGWSQVQTGPTQPGWTQAGWTQAGWTQAGPVQTGPSQPPGWPAGQPMDQQHGFGVPPAPPSQPPPDPPISYGPRS